MPVCSRSRSVATPEAFERCRPVMETFGNPVRLMGRLGTGQMTKILNNYFYAVHLGTAYDMGRLIRQLGFDLEAAAEVFPASSSSSWVFARYAETGFSQLTPTHPKGRDYGLTTLGRHRRQAADDRRRARGQARHVRRDGDPCAGARRSPRPRLVVASRPS